MDNIERALSLRLNDVLEKIGASETMRKLYQDTAITKEIISTIDFRIHNVVSSTYIFGSFSEGTTTTGLSSDVDFVYCFDKLPVIDDINTAPPGISFLMVRDDHTYPGYVKLQLVVDRSPRTIFDTVLTDSFARDSTGRMCFIHYSINRQSDERHGPADTTPGNDILISTDKVVSLKCKTIPHFVRDCLFRRRPNAWPTRDYLQTMSELCCFVVGVGHCSSQEFVIEWRLSFSLQERLLMFTFNPTQHKCYILLKMLKKEIIQQRIGESISSYHCKTCMFYAIENTKAKLWKPHKLLNCVRVCLMILLTWVYNGFCPNYFVSTENMFEMPRHRAVKDRLVLLLRNLVSQCPLVISHIQCDCLGQMIRNQTIYSQNNDICRLLHERYFYSVGTVVRFSKYINHICYKIIDPRNACQHLSYLIKSLQTARRITEHSEQQTRDAISFVIPVLHSQLAQRLMSFAFTPECQPYRQNILQYILHHIHEGRSFNSFTSRLLIATMLMKLEMHDVCEKILEGIGYLLKPLVISSCQCFMKHHEPSVKLLKLFNNDKISIKTFGESYIVTCVQFLPWDTEITPIPLRAEMFRSEDTIPGSRDERIDYWLDWAVVDGKVYLYFLQYLVYTELKRAAKKRVAIVNLVVVLNCDPHLYHKETGYNLLGWIYIQEGRYMDAIQCFQTSWKIRPHHNAAKFHIQYVPLDLD